MRSGTLRHKITIQTSTSTPNAVGEPVVTWTTYATPRAEVVDLSGREFFAAQSVHSEVTTRIRIRHRDGIVPKMRAVHGSRTFDVLSVTDATGRERELHLLCREVK